MLRNIRIFDPQSCSIVIVIAIVRGLDRYRNRARPFLSAKEPQFIRIQTEGPAGLQFWSRGAHRQLGRRTHDEVGGYSTNEPIMDGTANWTYLLSVLAGQSSGKR